MAKFELVASITTRHTIKIEAETKEDARIKAESIDVSEWTEDMEYYEFEITDIKPA